MVLYNWGEPLLHPDTFFFIRRAESSGIRTLLSSNMNVFSEETAREMIGSGLHRLIISMDGVTAETYETYRIGGNFEKVKEHIRLLVSTKRRLRAARPRLTLQFLVFRHNEHEAPAVEGMAQELGVDDVEILGGFLGGKGHTPYVGHPESAELAEKWLSKNPAYRGAFDYFRNDEYLSDQPCYFLWRTVAVNWDGSLTPCCCVYDESTNFGNIMEEPFSRIWNNAKYRSARALFSRRGSPPAPVRTVCDACKAFKPCHITKVHSP
jgi:radical SAM protein with 4Fe4S-binding SPASM domain